MLYLMRHGATDWNEIHRLQGRTDIPLNDKGRQMAERARVQYEDVHFDICYCSPLIRAKETAEIFLRGRDVPVMTDDRLKEMSFGICEGAQGYYDDPAHPMYVLFRHPEDYSDIPEGAESFKELFARTREFLNEVALPKLQQGKDVLILGHGAMNTSMVCQIKNIPLERFWSVGISQCTLTEFDLSGHVTGNIGGIAPSG